MKRYQEITHIEIEKTTNQLMQIARTTFKSLFISTALKKKGIQNSRLNSWLPKSVWFNVCCFLIII